MTTLGFEVRAAASADGREIIAEWGEPRDGERYRAAMRNGEQFFVAIRSTDVLGFASYRLDEGKHRTAVYVRGAAARQGVGAALFRAAESIARRCGAIDIHVDASLVAVCFYERQGFERLGLGSHRL